MAEGKEDKSREDLTEEASPHRLEEYRRKGMVSQSREISGMAVLLATSLTLFIVAPQFGYRLGEMMKEIFQSFCLIRSDSIFTVLAKRAFLKGVETFLWIGAPVSLAGFVIGIVATFAQIGPIFSWDPLSPDFSKINPIQGFKRLFSMKQLIEAARVTLKLVIVLAIAYPIVKEESFSSLLLLDQQPGAALSELSHVFQKICFSLFSILVVFAGLDFVHQKYDYSKNLRMTKQEAKQEHKEREGDPQIRARIRSIQREMARKRMMQAVKKADVVITNPTHIAVALVYDKVKFAAPKVVAKGADLIAQNMKKIAKEAGVPMVENVPLARALFKSVKVNQAIPRNLYQAVAEVLAYVYRLKRRV